MKMHHWLSFLFRLLTFTLMTDLKSKSLAILGCCPQKRQKKLLEQISSRSINAYTFSEFQNDRMMVALFSIIPLKNGRVKR
jgi:hypothetical protein